MWPTLAAAAVLVVLQALPALAAEGATGSEIAKGSVQGLILAAVFGVLGGTALTLHAYRGVRFGEAPAHQEHADDTRQGMTDYEPEVPDVTEVSGTA